MPYRDPEVRRQKARERNARPEVKEREAERLRKSYLARKEEIDARRRERYRANREKELARNRVWRASNVEHHRALCRKWAKDNPLSMRAIVARRRSRLSSVEGSYRAADIRLLFIQQGGLCKACACSLERYHVDHIIPITRGGSNWPENLQLLCPTCNRSKSNKTMEEWRNYVQKQVSGS